MNSDLYGLGLFGGRSTWDYEGLREEEAEISRVLLSLKPRLDAIFADTAVQLGL